MCLVLERLEHLLSLSYSAIISEFRGVAQREAVVVANFKMTGETNTCTARSQWWAKRASASGLKSRS